MPPRFIQKLRCWCIVVLMCMLMGNSLGQLVDMILWELSYDYVYPADYVRSNGIRLGGWLGTCIAAASVFGSRPLPNFAWTLKAGVGGMLLVCVIATAFAAVGWGMAKIGIRESETVSLSRAAFCTELVRGYFSGLFVIAALWMVAVWRHRHTLAIHAIDSPSQTLVLMP